MFGVNVSPHRIFIHRKRKNNNYTVENWIGNIGNEGQRGLVGLWIQSPKRTQSQFCGILVFGA